MPAYFLSVKSMFASLHMSYFLGKIIYTLIHGVIQSNGTLWLRRAMQCMFYSFAESVLPKDTWY